jgi:hypothetical protein
VPDSHATQDRAAIREAYDNGWSDAITAARQGRVPYLARYDLGSTIGNPHVRWFAGLPEKDQPKGGRDA